MRVFTLMVVGIMVLSGCIYVNASGDRYYSESIAKDHTFNIADVTDVEISFSAGEFKVAGTDADEISTHVSVTCKTENTSCLRIKDELNWGLEQKAGVISLVLLPKNIKSNSNVAIKAEVKIPKSKNLSVSMIAGALDVANYRGCLHADLTAGSIHAEVFKSAVADVILTAGVGGARLLVDGQEVKEQRKLLVGSKSQWSEGVGDCHLALSTDAGEVQLTLK